VSATTLRMLAGFIALVFIADIAAIAEIGELTKYTAVGSAIACGSCLTT